MKQSLKEERIRCPQNDCQDDRAYDDFHSVWRQKTEIANCLGRKDMGTAGATHPCVQRLPSWGKDTDKGAAVCPRVVRWEMRAALGASFHSDV